MSDPVRPHRRQPTRLPRPWDSPGRNTGVGCHCLLQCMKVKRESEGAQSCLTLSNPIDCSLPGSSIHGIFQARALEWVAIAFSGYHATLVLFNMPRWVCFLPTEFSFFWNFVLHSDCLLRSYTYQNMNKKIPTIYYRSFSRIDKTYMVWNYNDKFLCIHMMLSHHRQKRARVDKSVLPSVDSQVFH